MGRVARLTRVQRQAQTREALLDAAARLFVSRGLQGTSVEEISAEAGYTRGAFYSNFTSKEQLLVELLHDRLFSTYRKMAEQALADPERSLTARETGERLAAIQAHPDGQWLLRLWLECLVQATRDANLRELASTFWRGNRGLITELVRRSGTDSPDQAKAIATGLIALDIGLAIQHFVDPPDVPLSTYPDVYELLTGRSRSNR
jgi:AcrR family transcriptional regulator